MATADKQGVVNPAEGYGVDATGVAVCEGAKAADCLCGGDIPEVDGAVAS